MMKIGLVVGIIVLFIFSAFSSLVVGFNADHVEQSTFDDVLLQDYYGCYNLEEIPESIRPVISEDEENQNILPVTDNIINSQEPLISPPMDSPWPMYCHDTRHTSHSPYSTANNPFYEKWWYKCDHFVEGSAAIDKDGIIYFGSAKDDPEPNIYFYAMYPNGTLKWKCKIDWFISAGPTIAEDGTIYVGDRSYGSGKLYSISPNGKINWKLHTYGEMYSSPVIGPDGTIYVGDGDNYINAINPNGTFKWRYKTGLVVYSSPAIGDDGTVYCGSHDSYLYAFHPNNGTVKWKYKTGGWIRTAPCIGDDGTIYVVSLDNYLHAVHPNNGNRIWRTNVGAGTSPTIGQDGTIYAGYRKLYAVNPTNGSVKWTFPVGDTMRGGTPCNSLDGTIFVGTSDGGKIIAVNPDGTERWRTRIGTCEFAPIIGEDGTIYVGCKRNEWVGGGLVLIGFLHAFGKLDPNAPFEPEINGPTKGLPGIKYNYTFRAISPVNKEIYFYVYWGDQVYSGWQGPYASGKEITLSHTWRECGVYTIRVSVKDIENRWGPGGTLTVNTRDKAINNQLLFWRFLEQFPVCREVLLRLKVM
jgi:outer membrane protein assembly factor BamB